MYCSFKMHQLVVLVALFALSQAKFTDHFEKDNDFHGKIWVLLVAGSRGYMNYRHQADVCHAYQTIHRHGIPDEQIVVMMFDDIAHSEENPTPGVIINHPNGPDVYKGVPKDYTEQNVTPRNFLNILTGNHQAMRGVGSGKTIRSGPEDHVFVYFADHGSSGLIAFPDSQLLRDDLNNAIETMHRNRQYKQLVLYVEACESGSMFERVMKPNINVYVTTAANSRESSYACYYDNNRDTYLGDRYSVSWLEDSDQENIQRETLHRQYQVVRANTHKSHVMQYGNVSLSTETVSMFQGRKKASTIQKPLPKILDDVPSPDVPIHILQRRLEAASTHEEQINLQTQLDKEFEIRRRITWATDVIARHAAQGDKDILHTALHSAPQLHQFQCYKDAIRHFDEVCFQLSKHEYSYRRLFVFGNLCDAGVSARRILSSIQAVCH